MAKKRKFTDIWVNQTKLGLKFGISAIAIGKHLKELGLKDNNNRATQKAIEGGYCQETPLKDGKYFVMWHKNKVSQLLESEFGLIPLGKAESKALELAKEWKSAYQEYEKHGTKIQLLWLDEIIAQAKKANLIEQVNAILQQDNFKGELLGE